MYLHEEVAVAVVAVLDKGAVPQDPTVATAMFLSLHLACP